MMKKNFVKSTAYWVDLIAKEELPAITSTARLLDSFANDDISSLPKLSRAILHDQALSSCVLKVANSIAGHGHSKISTVSRASVVLGIQPVKNICLTSKLIEGLIKAQTCSPAIFERLTRLMATSFYSGLLARMIIGDYNEDTKEQVYLAAMLYRIGETAFWSAGGEAAEELIEQILANDDPLYDKTQEVIGTSFTEISRGLAKEWSLGDLLEKSLDHPENRTVEIQIISLADKLGCYIDQPPDSEAEFDYVLKQIASIKKVSVRQLKYKIEQVRENAIALLETLGANLLTELIKPLPSENSFKQKTTGSLFPVSKEQAQLNSLMKLSELVRKSTDLNDFIEHVLFSLANNLAFERSSFFILANDKNSLKSRLSVNHLGEKCSYKTSVNIGFNQNAFSYVIKFKKAIVINDHTDVKWRHMINQEIEQLLEQGVMCLAPVSIGHNVIGLIAGQCFEKKQKISEIDFSHFSFLVEHLTMCLSMISRK